MKTLWILVIVALAFGSSACSSKSDDKAAAAVSAGPDRTCKTDVITSLNMIKLNANLYNNYKDRQYLVAVQDACSRYMTLMANGSCEASVAGQIQTLTPELAAPTCDYARVTLNPKPNPVPAPEPQPAPAPENLADMEKGFKIIIRDEALFNQMVLEGANALIQDGEFVAGNESLNQVSPYCHLQKKEVPLVIRAGDVMEFSNIDISAEKISAQRSDFNLDLICQKFDFSEWTMTKLRTVFGEKADVFVIE